ncbi:MAG: hypothetical protein KKE50_05930 [Nanoarchaeota archaeon]|nr:hypothetical protein [Nanoarchaeota archaeon]
MKTKTIILLIILALVLTASTLFLKIIPCKSWYGSNTGVLDMMPHNTFCNLISGSISFGPYNEYYYLTTNPSIAFLITFAIFLIIVFVIGLLLLKNKK